MKWNLVLFEENYDNGKEDAIDALTLQEQWQPIVFTPFDVAQDFSLKSVFSEGLCDEEHNMLRLSDPAVIHYKIYHTGKIIKGWSIAEEGQTDV